MAKKIKANVKKKAKGTNGNVKRLSAADLQKAAGGFDVEFAAEPADCKDTSDTGAHSCNPG